MPSIVPAEVTKASESLKSIKLVVHGTEQSAIQFFKAEMDIICQELIELLDSLGLQQKSKKWWQTLVGSTKFVLRKDQIQILIKRLDIAQNSLNFILTATILNVFTDGR